MICNPERIKFFAVLATIPPFLEGRAKDRNYVKFYPGGEFLCDLAEACEVAGFPFLTIDQYLRDHNGMPGLLISDMGLGREHLSHCLRPGVCINLESPIVTTRFAHFLKYRASIFSHVFTYKGMGERLQNTASTFHPIIFPSAIRRVVGEKAWNERSLLTLIANNKNALTWNLPPITSGPGSIVMALLRGLLTLYIKTVDPWMRSNLYIDRQKIVSYFDGKEGFRLYGKNWDVSVVGEISPHYEDKLRVLGESRFALCLENTAFSGFITEKLFDALFAGAIPIYLGAPDVEDWIPASCFIDLRKFDSLEALDFYIRNISETDAQIYLLAARSFIESEQFDFFTSKHLADRIVSALNEVSFGTSKEC
jgi:hypothetical protein